MIPLFSSRVVEWYPVWTLNELFFYKEKNDLYRGGSAALGNFLISIFFGQVDNKKSKKKYSSIAV